MIVQCPQCSSKYRVKDEKIPEGGGRITCPSCEHRFVVQRDDSGSDSGRGGLDRVADEMDGTDSEPSVPEGDPTQIMTDDNAPSFLEERDEEDVEDDGTVEMRNPFHELHGDEESDAADAEQEGDDDPTAVMDRDKIGDQLEEELGSDDLLGGGGSDTAGPTKETSTDGLGISTDEPSSGPPQDRGVESPGDTGDGAVPGAGSGSSRGAAGPEASSQSGTRQPGRGAGGAPEDHDGPWKLQGEHGLTYEFPDTTALRDWLADREELDELELSPDGSTFYPLSEFPQVADLAGGSGRSAAHQPASGGGSAASSAESGSQPPVPSGNQPDGRGSSSQPGPGAEAPGGGGPPASPPGSESGGPPSGARSRAPESPGDSAGGPEAPSGGDRRDAPGPGSQAPGGGSGGPGAAQPSSGPKQPQSPGLPEKREEALGSGRASDPARGTPGRSRTWTWMLYGVLALLLVVAAGVFLEVSGIYPVAAHIPGVPSIVDRGDGDSEPAVAQGAGSGAGAPDASTGDAGPSPDAPDAGSGEQGEVDRLLAAAKDSIDQDQLQTAIEKLSAAKLLEPDRVETYELLAKVHEKLGDSEAAAENRERAEALRSEAGVDGPDAGGLDAELSDAEQ